MTLVINEQTTSECSSITSICNTAIRSSFKKIQVSKPNLFYSDVIHASYNKPYS